MAPPKFTNSELVDILLVYGEVGQNYSAARRRYAELYPDRRVPSSKTLSTLIYRVRETGSLQSVSFDGRCERTTRSLELEESVSEAIQNNPSLSIRQIARELNVSYATVKRAVDDSGVSQSNEPSRCHTIHTLEPDVYPARQVYCQWIIEKYTEKVDFPLEILFTDEACFTQDGVFNIHYQNPFSTDTNEDRFSINIWAGVVDNTIIGPFVLPDSVTKRSYRNFLQNNLQPLLENVPFNVRRQMWFQHSGATPYFTTNILKYLTDVFEDRMIVRGGPVAWPPCSPDLNPVEFFLWNYIKQMVYKTKVNNVDELKCRIKDAVKDIKTKNLLEHVMRSLILRACLCIQAGGSSFHHLL